MAGSSNFLQFNPTGANMLSDEDYNAATMRQDGFAQGIAPSNLFNKIEYQNSVMVAALAEFMSNNGFTVSDAIYNNLVACITANLSPVIFSDTEPNPSFPGMSWVDTDGGNVWYQRNQAGDGWITRGIWTSGGFGLPMQYSATAPAVTFPGLNWGDTSNNINWRRNNLDTLWNLIAPSGSPLVPASGWIPFAYNGELSVVTYGSATTIVVAGVDLTSFIQKGFGVKFNQHDLTKCFYVLSTSFGGGNTTITLTPGSDTTGAACVVENTASYPITNAFWTPCPSNAFGFIDWIPYTATITGFTSTKPTNVVSRFKVIGSTAKLVHSEGTAGISNASTFTVSLPITAKTIAAMVWWAKLFNANDNGSWNNTCDCSISSGDSIVTLAKGGSSTGWTNSGNKMASFEIWYEI
jgi:hypothetical protein